MIIKYELGENASILLLNNFNCFSIKVPDILFFRIDFLDNFGRFHNELCLFKKSHDIFINSLFVINIYDINLCEFKCQ